MRRGRLPCPGHHWHQTPAPADTHPRSPLQGGGHLNPGPGSCLHGAAHRALLNNSISTILQPALGPLTETGKGFKFQPLPWSWVFSSPGGEQWPVPVFSPTPSPLNSEYPVLLKLAGSTAHPLRLMITTNFRLQTNKLRPPWEYNSIAGSSWFYRDCIRKRNTGSSHQFLGKMLKGVVAIRYWELSTVVLWNIELGKQTIKMFSRIPVRYWQCSNPTMK